MEKGPKLTYAGEYGPGNTNGERVALPNGPDGGWDGGRHSLRLHVPVLPQHLKIDKKHGGYLYCTLLRIRIIGYDADSESGSRRVKITRKSRKN
jgi:hypothetical protein